PPRDDEEFEHEPKKEVHISESLKNADLQDPDRKARLKAAMGVGVPEPGASRLDLGPIDENRPILTSSGYQPPAWWKYLLAYVAFTVALLWVFDSSKQFKELLMPWDAPEFNFTEGQMPTIQDTRALRNTSNVTQFEFFSQGPFVFLAWVLVLVFAFRGVYIVWGTLSSFYWSYRTWRSERKARKHDPNENVHARMDRL